MRVSTKVRAIEPGGGVRGGKAGGTGGAGLRWGIVAAARGWLAAVGCELDDCVGVPPGAEATALDAMHTRSCSTSWTCRVQYVSPCW